MTQDQHLSPPHDDDDPLGHLNRLEAIVHAVERDRWMCRWCRTEAKPVPMSGNGWGVEVTHEEHCREHEDNQPAVMWQPGHGDLPGDAQGEG